METEELLPNEQETGASTEGFHTSHKTETEEMLAAEREPGTALDLNTEQPISSELDHATTSAELEPVAKKHRPEKKNKEVIKFTIPTQEYNHKQLAEGVRLQILATFGIVHIHMEHPTRNHSSTWLICTMVPSKQPLAPELTIRLETNDSEYPGRCWELQVINPHPAYFGDETLGNKFTGDYHWGALRMITTIIDFLLLMKKGSGENLYERDYITFDTRASLNDYGTRAVKSLLKDKKFKVNSNETQFKDLAFFELRTKNKTIREDDD